MQEGPQSLGILLWLESTIFLLWFGHPGGKVGKGSGFVSHKGKGAVASNKLSEAKEPVLHMSTQ